MTTFFVWDEEDGATRESATEIKAFCATDAAEYYAEHDIDGNIDGIYQDGHPLIVEGDAGRWRVIVEVEYEPVYYTSAIDPLPGEDGGVKRCGGVER